MSMPTVTIALDWTANPNHSGLVVALQRRLFAAEGVEARVLPPDAARSPVDLVLSGAADLAFAYAGTVIERRDLREPLISVAAVAPRHCSSLVALRSSGITRPADFQGKRYASFGHPLVERGVIEQMMRADGVAAPEFTLERVKYATVAGLQRGEYDFLWVFDGIEGVEAALAGIELVSFSPSRYGVPEYSAPVIFGSEEIISNQERCAAARRCMRALAQGYATALSEPDAVLADIHAVAPQLGGWLFADDAETLASLRYLSQHWQRTDGAPWGAQTLEMWTPFPRFLWEHGALAAQPEPIYAAMFSNDVINAE